MQNREKMAYTQEYRSNEQATTLSSSLQGKNYRAITLIDGSTHHNMIAAQKRHELELLRFIPGVSGVYSTSLGNYQAKGQGALLSGTTSSGIIRGSSSSSLTSKIGKK